MANPVLTEEAFSRQYVEADRAMTYNGVITKSIILLLLTVISASYVFIQTLSGYSNMVAPIATAGFFIALVLGFVIAFFPKTSPYLAPIYALSEGAIVGSISAMFQAELPGIVAQAILGTFAAMFSVLALYTNRIIIMTAKLRKIIFMATLSIAILYFVQFILFLFHISIPQINTSSPIGIAFSVIVIIIAVSNFLIDFDMIEVGVKNFAPKYMEWYSGFGLLVTLVWVYLEILRLLAKLRRR